MSMGTWLKSRKPKPTTERRSPGQGGPPDDPGPPRGATVYWPGDPDPTPIALSREESEKQFALAMQGS